MKVKYPGKKCKLCFTDTDSLLYRLKTDDRHRDMMQSSDLYDFSDYPADHACFANMNTSEIEHVRLRNKSCWQIKRRNVWQ